MNESKKKILTDKLGQEWFDILKDEFDKPHMVKLSEGLKEARRRKVIYPEPENIFRAFEYTPFSKVKVIWIGMDPYNKGEANGLSFDCSRVDYLTPSWRKIFDEYDKTYPTHFAVDLMDGSLKRWAEQGVFLLNAALTVPKGEPGKHLKHWKPFTEKVLQLLAQDKNPKVFVALGKNAEELLKDNHGEHALLIREHPAYAARQGRLWDGNWIFHQINNEFIKHNVDTIDW